MIDLRRPEMSKAKRSRYLNVDAEFIQVISYRVRLVRRTSFLFALHKFTRASFAGAKLTTLPLYTSIPALFSSNRVIRFETLS